MAGAELVFNIFARDHGASRTFRSLARATSTLGDSFNKLQVGGKFAAIGGAAVATTPHILALTASIANVAPAAYLIAPAALAGGAALGTLKLALHGVGEAMDAKTPQEFREALKGLAPSARSFVVELRKMGPAFAQLRLAVQDSAFRGLAAQMKPLAANLLPTVRRGLVGIAAAGNSAATSLALFFRTNQAKSLLGTALQGVAAAFKDMSGIPAKLAKSFLQMTVAAMPAFQRLSAAITGLFTKFGAYVNDKSTGGALTAMINGAMDTLAQLGRVAGNIGSIIGGIFKAADDGGGFLSSIERVTKAIADAVNSKKGQEVLQKVFDLMAKAGPIIAIGGALAFVIGSIGAAVAALVEPAAAIAAVIVAVGAGFVYLYNKSSGLRDIVGIVGGKLKELWDLFAAKGLPIIKNFAEKALGTAVAGFNLVRDAVARNRPELEQLWGVVKKVAAAIMASWPAMSAVGVGALKAIFTGAVLVIQVVSALVRQFNFVKGVITTAMAVGAAAVRSFRTAAGTAVEAVIGFMKGLPGRIRAAVGDLGSLLAGAGRSIIQGLIGGVRSAIGELKSTLGGITNMIPDWKGPMSVDRGLLVPTGRAIMGGLMDGIGGQVAPLRRQLQGVTAGISVAGISSAGSVGSAPGVRTVGGGAMNAVNTTGRMPVAAGAAGGNTYNFHLPNYIGSHADLKRELVSTIDELRRSGWS